jgi:hypothetical protein
MSNSWIVIVFMLFFVLVMALYLGSQSYNAYVPSRSGLSEYPYEGFAASQNAFENREGVNSERKANPKPKPKPPTSFSLPTSFSTSSSNSPFGSFVFPQSNTQAPVDPSLNPAPAPAPLTGSPSSTFKEDSFATFDKEGFESTISKQISEGKITGASYSDQKPIGFMYNNQGSPTCKNYGYTNSQGFICMSEGDIQLLTTRGGNATGASDQIGK